MLRAVGHLKIKHSPLPLGILKFKIHTMMGAAYRKINAKKRWCNKVDRIPEKGNSPSDLESYGEGRGYTISIASLEIMGRLLINNDEGIGEWEDGNNKHFQ